MRNMIVIAAKQSGKSRLATFQDREHIVIPVVMMCEGVVHAGNSETADLVLSEEFSKQPNGWNGRPVMAGHPQRHGEFISANYPDVLEAECFGSIFATEATSTELKAEAWIDKERATKTETGRYALDKIDKGEPLEVSVGVFANTEKVNGEFNGKKYAGIWRNLVPDHLAILPPGVPGACDLAMGCGALRAAERNNMAKGIKERFQQFVAALRAETSSEILDAAAPSDQQVRHELNKMLRAEEPGFIGVEEVFSAEGKVVFSIMPEDRWVMIRRSFTVNDSTVVLGGDREEVKFVQSFEPIAAEAPKAACGCGGQTHETPAVPTALGDVNMNKTERINALVASKKLGPAMTVKVLESLTDEQLATLETEAAAAVVETPVTAVAAVVTAPVAPIVQGATQMTTEQYFALLPPELAALQRNALKATQDKRAADIATIKANAKNNFTDVELAGMDNTMIERLAAISAVPEKTTRVGAPVDFSGMGLPRVASGRTDKIEAQGSTFAALAKKN